MSNTMQLMDLNNLIYGQSVDLSAGIDRKLIERYPEKTDYTDKEELIFTLNNTKQFVDMANSSLSFTFSQNGGDACGLTKNNSALNLIKRVIVTAPDGTKLSHCDKMNLLQSNLLKVKHSKSFLETPATSFLYNTKNNTWTDPGTEPVVDVYEPITDYRQVRQEIIPIQVYLVISANRPASLQ